MLNLKTLVLFLVIVGLLLVHILTQLPYLTQVFNFDEIDYAYQALLLLEGKGFYSISFHDRLPGIYLVYTLAGLIFREVSPIAIRFLTLFFTSSAVIIFFLITSKIFGKVVGFLSAFFFAIFIVDPSVQGHTANTETFAVAFFLFGIWLFIQKNKFLASIAPFVTGITILFRPTMIFLVFLLSFLLYKQDKKPTSRFIITAVKIATPLILTIFYMTFSGNISQFLEWTVERNANHMRIAYLGKYFIGNASFTFQNMIMDSCFFWLFGLLGVIFFAFSKDLKIKTAYFFLYASIASILFSGWFFQHYFIELVPVFSLFAGLLYAKIISFQNRFRPIILSLLFTAFLIGMVGHFIDQSAYLNDRLIKRKVVQPEDQKNTDIGYPQVLNEIQKNPDASIFVWDDIPRIYVLAKKIPVSYFSYKEPLLPNNLLPPTFNGYFPKYKIYQKQLMDELRKKFPEIVVVRKDDNFEEEKKAFPEFFQFLSNFYSGDESKFFIFYRKPI